MINKANVFIFSVLLFQIPGLLYAQEIPTTDSGTTAWMLTSTALVLLMIPGLAMFYGGLVRTKNVLGTMMHSYAAMAIIGVLWAVCGYSLSFGKNILGGWIGWDSNLLFLNGAYDAIDFAGGTVVHISAGISALVAALYLGSRRGYPKTAMQPNNLVMTLMGAGSIILTFFIRSSWMQETALLAGGAWAVWQQLGVQVTAVVITIALLLFVQKTVGFRLEEQAEKAGMDSSLHGEHGYGLLNLN